MKLTLSTRRIILGSFAGLALFVTTVNAEEKVIDKEIIYRPGESYLERVFLSSGVDTTYKYDSIISDNIQFNVIGNSESGDRSFNIEVGSIDTSGADNPDDGKVWINTSGKGNVTLNDVQANYIQVSTNQGDITLSGNITTTKVSAVTISKDGGAGGTIILNNASLTNVSLENLTWNPSFMQTGRVDINGVTSLKNVYINVETVNVADSTKLTLNDTAFTNQSGSMVTQELVLGDDVVLTLSADELLEVNKLTIGNNLDIILTLNEDVLNNLANRTFDIFAVENGDVDLSMVDIYFTDGVNTVSTTFTTEGGQITVTGTQPIPEPTTVTLSLLALAGLAARRRRCR